MISDYVVAVTLAESALSVNMFAAKANVCFFVNALYKLKIGNV